MDFRGGDIPAPANGGDLLLQLLRRPPASHQPGRPEQPSQNFYNPEAAAAAGTSVPAFSPYLPWGGSSSPPFAPHNYFPQNPNANPNLNPEFSSPPNWGSNQFHRRSNGASLGHDAGKSEFRVENLNPSVGGLQEQKLVFGSFDDAGNVLPQTPSQKGNLGNSYRGDNLGVDVRLGGFQMSSTGMTGNVHGYYSNPRGYEPESKYSNDVWGAQGPKGNFRAVEVPRGFSTKLKNVVDLDIGRRRTWDHDLDSVDDEVDYLIKNIRRLNKQLDSYCQPAGNSLNSCFNLEGPVTENRHENGDYREESRGVGQEKGSQDELRNELDDLEGQLVDSLRLGDEADEKSDKKKHPRDKDYRSDSRGQWIMGQRMRNQKSQRPCRSDINSFTSPFLEVFQTLIPAGEEKIKQKQMLLTLENLVSKEWPEARLFLYGSCANSFGFPNSDIDVCLVTQNKDIDKREMLLRLADILELENFQNVQALTRARVPIVKLMDPATGISCDICVNNVLAVVNTKLLRDYSKIDVRLRQLVFIVKHWAKSRRVNETYQGTLSSYAYVLMCIHFLQQRMPPILPCLQRMKTTYFANVDNVDCSYFDQVENLDNFGVRNRESIAQLVWGFFHYWAYCHDYANDVISVRMGSTISKRAKDWTRRVGNDRHLICIEDPFEVSHDLGRVVDKYSIRVLREEFVRAAEVMHYDANPFVTLFEPYIPN